MANPGKENKAEISWLVGAEKTFQERQRNINTNTTSIDEKTKQDEQTAIDFLKSNVGIVYPHLERIANNLKDRGYQVFFGYQWDYFFNPNLKPPATTQEYKWTGGADDYTTNDSIPIFVNLSFATGTRVEKNNFCSARVCVGLDDLNNFRLGLQVNMLDDPPKMIQEVGGTSCAGPTTNLYPFLDELSPVKIEEIINSIQSRIAHYISKGKYRPIRCQ